MNNQLRIASRKSSPISASLKAIVWTLPFFIILLADWVVSSEMRTRWEEESPWSDSYIAKSAAAVLVAAFLVGLVSEMIRSKRT